MSIETDLAVYVADAEAFLQKVITGVEAIFGSASPVAAGISRLAKDLKADIESVVIVVDGVEQTVIATEAMIQQVIAFVSNVKAGVTSGPLASTWEQEVLAVLSMGVPLALSVLAPGSGPVVMLAESVISKLLALT